jgi:hypothetical protein
MLEVGGPVDLAIRLAVIKCQGKECNWELTSNYFKPLN